jgi:hypothetical protein
MKKILLVAAAVSFALGGLAWAQGQTGCAGCPNAQVTGYLAPNFRMIDKGDGLKSNMGFGMAFNRFTFSGMVECGKIVKNVGFKVEGDISNPSGLALQDAFVQPQFSEAFSFRLGHYKKAFSREVLHPTSKLLTVDRGPSTAFLKALGYSDYNYGLEAIIAQEKFKVNVGAYAGQGTSGAETNGAANQDPMLDFGARAIFKVTPDIEIGANAMMVGLPYEDPLLPADANWDSLSYESNSAMAFGFDVDFQKQFNPNMGIWLQAELGMGDNWDADLGGGPKEPEAEDTWEDYSWYGFMYYYAKVLFMVTPEFGIHLGYWAVDPNTESGNADNGYIGENDSVSWITPGIVYKWCKATRTQLEVQLVSHQNGVDSEGDNLDDDTYTHFVLQQVMTW